MATKKKTKARKGKRQTGDRVATIAGKVLRILKSDAGSTVLVWETPLGDPKAGKITVADVKALAASCLVQDTVKGKRR